MDEAAVAAQVAQVLPQSAPVITGPSNKDEVQDITQLLLSRDLLDFFAVSKDQEYGVEEKLSKMLGYLQEQGITDRLDVMRKLRDLEIMLGLTHRFDEKLTGLYRYLKLDSQRRRIEQEMGTI